MRSEGRVFPHLPAPRRVYDALQPGESGFDPVKEHVYRGYGRDNRDEIIHHTFGITAALITIP